MAEFQGIKNQINSTAKQARHSESFRGLKSAITASNVIAPPPTITEGQFFPSGNSTL